MANILFLAHRIPYPPNKGDKIRSWHFLEHLTKRHSVHLVCYVDDARDLRHVSFLRSKLKSVFIRYVGLWEQKLLALKGLFLGRSLTLASYPHGEVAQQVKDIFEREKIDLVFVFSAGVAPLVSGRPNGIPVIADLVDVDSEKWSQYAESARFPLSWLYRREARLLSDYERHLTAEVDRAVFVSSDEAKLFERRVLHGLSDRVTYINNGVDITAFDPTRFEKRAKTNPVVIFTGAMDYAPNIEAVEWFVREVWTSVVAEVPDALFVIAGSPVHPKVKSLERSDVKVLGFVEDMAAKIAVASVVVAPLRTARGVQNKVLEGMAMAKAVVASPEAKEGIEAEEGKHLIVAESPKEFGNAVIELLKKPDDAEKLGAHARLHIKDQYQWSSSFSKLDALIDAALRES